jgi:hypothetical protein
MDNAQPTDQSRPLPDHLQKLTSLAEFARTFFSSAQHLLPVEVSPDALCQLIVVAQGSLNEGAQSYFDGDAPDEVVWLPSFLAHVADDAAVPEVPGSSSVHLAAAALLLLGYLDALGVDVVEAARLACLRAEVEGGK